MGLLAISVLVFLEWIIMLIYFQVSMLDIT